MEKGGIVLFEQMQGESNMGSSRIRGHWLIRAWNEDKTIDSSLEVFQQGAKYDFIIFQKAYWLEYAEKFEGIKILDICDPDWLAGSCVKRMTDCVDGVTTSSQVLADSLKEIIDSLRYMFDGWRLLTEKMRRSLINRISQFWYLEQEKVKENMKTRKYIN